MKIPPHWTDRRGAHPLAIGNFDREVTTIRDAEINLCDNRLRIRGGTPAIRGGVLVESGGALFISAFLDIVRRRGESIYGGCSSGEALVPFGGDAVFGPPRRRREDAVPEKAQAGIRQLDLARHFVFLDSALLEKQNSMPFNEQVGPSRTDVASRYRGYGQFFAKKSVKV